MNSEGTSIGTPTIFQALWNGAVVTGSLLSNVNAANGVYSFFSFTVQGTGSDELAFQGRNIPNFVRLDDISLVAEAPELSASSSWIPLAMTLFSVMLLQGRRRRSIA